MLSLNKADTYFLKGDIVMAKVCINCGKKIGVIMDAPLELCDGQALCSGCAGAIRGDFQRLYKSLYSDDANFDAEFSAAKDVILQKCKKVYSTTTTVAIENKIDEIYRDEIKPQFEKNNAEKRRLQAEEEKLAAEQRAAQARTEELVAEQQKAREQLLTTGYDFSGYKISKYLGIVSGEVVLGTGFLSEFSASVSDLLGASSWAFEEKLDTAKQAAVEKLTMKSVKAGGNAIIGIDFDYITFANNMIGVVANGTSVVVEKIE